MGLQIRLILACQDKLNFTGFFKGKNLRMFTVVVAKENDK